MFLFLFVTCAGVTTPNLDLGECPVEEVLLLTDPCPCACGPGAVSEEIYADGSSFDDPLVRLGVAITGAGIDWPEVPFDRTWGAEALPGYCE